MENNNPIKYSDLISPDNSINNLIEQLKNLEETYTATLKNIRIEAEKLNEILKNTSGATEEGRKATRKAADDAEKLAKAQRDLAFAESENAKKLAELRLAQQEANQLNKLIVKLNNSAEGSYNHLSAQYSINKIYINNMTQAERDEAEAREGLITKTRELYEEMKRMQEETGKHQLNVGNYPQIYGKASQAVGGFAEKVTGAVGLNNEMGETLIALGKGGEEAKAVFTGLADGAKALGKTLLGLLKNPVFLAIAGIAAAGAAFKWWYDYNAGLVEATRLTQQFTDKSGEDLINYRIKVQAVAETFDKDFKEVLIAANAIAKQFGITADEALQIIQDGFIAGADANGEFLDIIKEYPAYFKEAGLTASEFVAIVAQTNKSGIFSDKGIDAIKEANIRLREMTPATASALDAIGISSEQVQKDLRSGAKTTFDIMQEVSVKLNELPDSAAVVGTAIADIFGGPGEDAGLQYLRTLKDITTELDKVKEKAGELSRIQEEVLASEVELQKSVSALFDETGGDFERLKADVQIFINNTLRNLINDIISIINFFGDLYNNSVLIRGVWHTIGVVLEVIVDTIGAAIGLIYDAVTGLILMVKGLATLDFEELARGADRVVDAIPNFIKKGGKGIEDAITGAIESAQKKIKPIKIEVETTEVTKATTSVNQYGTTITTKSGKVPKAELEEAHEKLKIKKQYEEALIKLEQDSFSKRRRLVQKQYEIERADLRHNLIANADTLTADEQKLIGAQIRELIKKRNEDIAQINREERAANLTAERAYQDAILNAQEEGFAKQRQAVQYQYDRNIEDLRIELEEEKTLTEAERKAINARIISLEEQKARELRELNNQEQIFNLEQVKKANDLRLKTITEGTEEEKRLKLEQLEIDRQIALAQNAAKPMSEQLSTTDINAFYDKQRGVIVDSYIQTQLQLFDQQQKFQESEFDLLRKTEREKTIFKLQQEKERLQKILELNKTANKKLTEEEVKTISNQIKAIDNQIAETRPTDIYELMGLSLTPEKKQVIADSVNFAFDMLNMVMQKRVEAANAAVNEAQKEVESAQRALDYEKQARANGYASNVAFAQKELDMAKKNQEEAIKEQQKAQKAQQAVQAVQTAGNLVASSALIWAQLGFPFAIPAIAIMWGSFAAAQIKAAQVTRKNNAQTYGEGGLEYLAGGSHQSGNDINIGTTADGRERRAEGGEMLAIINKRSTRRYRKLLPGLISAINNGTIEEFLHAYPSADSINIGPVGNIDIRGISDDVKAIKERGEKQIYYNGDKKILRYKNLTKTIK